MLNPVGAVKDDDLIKHIRSWFDLIASDQIEDACKQLDEPNKAGIVWTPQKVMEAVATALHIKNDSALITRSAASTGSPEVRVFRLLNGSGYAVEHRVPLNGQYCNVIAIFEFLWRRKALAFVLDGLYVF